MKMSVTTASTRNDRSRMANAGVEAGAKMLGVEIPVEAIRLMPYRRARRGYGDGSLTIAGDLEPGANGDLDLGERCPGRLGGPRVRRAPTADRGEPDADTDRLAAGGDGGLGIHSS